jgi:predicted AAA+ superfamily ATPase
MSGETINTAPVMTLITQFGGGKTHTLATLYHLANNGDAARFLLEFRIFVMTGFISYTQG